MYETVRLKEKHLDLFAHLDPYNMLELGKLPDRVCIGTVQKGENGFKDIPAGLMVCRLTKSDLVMEWVYVDGSCRYQCIGAGLMRRAFEEARKRGFDIIYAYLVPCEKREVICEGEKDFLKDYNMKLVKPGKDNAALFKKLVPEQFIGADLYSTDVAGYFEAMAAWRR